jgi:hypothetical protein
MIILILNVYRPGKKISLFPHSNKNFPIQNEFIILKPHAGKVLAMAQNGEKREIKINLYSDKKENPKKIVNSILVAKPCVFL